MTIYALGYSNVEGVILTNSSLQRALLDFDFDGTINSTELKS